MFNLCSTALGVINYFLFIPFRRESQYPLSIILSYVSFSGKIQFQIQKLQNLMLSDFLAVPSIMALAAVFSYIVGRQSRLLWGTPIFWWLTGYSFVLQFVAFIPSAILNTERFFDLTGGIAFLSITLIATLSNDAPTGQQYLAAAMVGVWAFRLGFFLFSRVMKKGQDSRFEEIKKSKLKFLVVWMFQAFWVIVPMSPLLVIMTGEPKNSRINSTTLGNTIGFIVWALGLAIEVVSDYQKSDFNSKPENKGKFISTGLWSISRHPNYVGEIVVWIGSSIFAFSGLEGGQYLALISPVFVYILLMKVSGVNILQERADKKWGNVPSYQQYKKRTPILFPIGGIKGQKQYRNL